MLIVIGLSFRWAAPVVDPLAEFRRETFWQILEPHYQ